MLSALLETPGAEAVAKAGLTLVESSILGAVAVLSIAAAVFALWKLGKIQDQRVTDLQKMNTQMEGYIRESQSAVNGFTSAIQGLTTSEKETTQLLSQLKWSIDSVVSEAVKASRYARSYSPDRGTPGQSSKSRG